MPHIVRALGLCKRWLSDVSTRPGSSLAEKRGKQLGGDALRGARIFIYWILILISSLISVNFEFALFSLW